MGGKWGFSKLMIRYYTWSCITHGHVLQDILHHHISTFIQLWKLRNSIFGIAVTDVRIHKVGYFISFSIEHIYL